MIISLTEGCILLEPSQITSPIKMMLSVLSKPVICTQVIGFFLFIYLISHSIFPKATIFIALCWPLCRGMVMSIKERGRQNVKREDYNDTIANCTSVIPSLSRLYICGRQSVREKKCLVIVAKKAWVPFTLTGCGTELQVPLLLMGIIISPGKYVVRLN